MRDFAAHSGVHVFHHALPLSLGHAPEDGTKHQFFIAAEGVMHMRFELPDLIYPSVDLGNFAVGHRRIGRRVFQVRRALGRNHQRQLVAQAVSQQAEGCHLAGRIQPDFLLSHGQHSNDVVELRRRRDVGIEFAAGID